MKYFNQTSSDVLVEPSIIGDVVGVEKDKWTKWNKSTDIRLAYA
jgi:hypothetical protein